MTLPYSQSFYAAVNAALFTSRLKECVGHLRLNDTMRQPLFALPSREDDLAAMEQWTANVAQRFDRLVVLGTGGSSLGGKMFAFFAQNRFTSSRVYFLDNADPHTLDELLASIDIKRTAFLAISKSGNTVDTLALVDPLHAACRAAGCDTSLQWTAITMQDGNPLAAIAAKNNWQLFPHDAALGGRFSLFSEVALLPAMFAGLDVRALRAGAQAALDECRSSDTGGMPGAGAVAHSAHMADGKTIHVFMPYTDRLALLGAWHRQVWAESVGKEGKGSTPMPAIGAVDQHSQLQIFLEGPRDKFFTLLMPPYDKRGAEMPAEPVLPCLKDKFVGDVLMAQGKATAETLRRHDCPLRVITLERLDEFTLGALAMHFFLETIFTAHLLGINAYDQPAVEESKQLTRQYLSA